MARVLPVLTVCVIPANCAWLRPDLTRRPYPERRRRRRRGKGIGRLLYLFKRAYFDLPNAFSRNVEFVGKFLECRWFVV
jgi:hypothetical protein